MMHADKCPHSCLLLRRPGYAFLPALLCLALAPALRAQTSDSVLEYDFDYIESLHLDPAPDPSQEEIYWDINQTPFDIPQDMHLGVSPTEALDLPVESNQIEVATTSPEQLAAGCEDGFIVQGRNQTIIPGTPQDFVMQSFWDLSAASQIYGTPWQYHRDFLKSDRSRCIAWVREIGAPCGNSWCNEISVFRNVEMLDEQSPIETEYVNCDFSGGTSRVEISSSPRNGDLGAYYPSLDLGDGGLTAFTEWLRVVQFYNAASLGCQPGTEDGFAPNDPDQDCAPHASDYHPQDWTISLTELLRLIQYYNSGGYHPCLDGEDGFCPATH